MSCAAKCERFSENERSILFGLARSLAKVIENKKTDFSNLTAKKEAWAQIECKFNSHPDVSKRTTAQLKKCWDNEKTKQKKALALATRQRMATGGGPFVKDPHPVPELEIALGSVLHCVDDAVDCDTMVCTEHGVYVETVMPESIEGCIPNEPEEASDSDIPPPTTSGPHDRQSSSRRPTIDEEVERRFLNLERTDRRARKVLAMQQAEHRFRMRASKAMAEAEEQHLANEQGEAARAVVREERAARWELRAEERKEELHAQQLRHADEQHAQKLRHAEQLQELRVMFLTEANSGVPLNNCCVGFIMQHICDMVIASWGTRHVK